MVPWWSVGPSALADPCMTWRFWDEMGLAHGAMVPTWAGLVCVAQKGAQAVRLSGSVRPRPSERPREPSLTDGAWVPGLLEPNLPLPL